MPDQIAAAIERLATHPDNLRVRPFKAGSVLTDEAGNPVGADTIVETVGGDLDLTAETTKTVTIALGSQNAEIVRGRLYIDVDPAAPVTEEAVLTLYNKVGMRGEDALYRATMQISRTVLDNPTAVGSPNVDLNDNSDFDVNMLGLILDTTNEYFRVKTQADPIVAEDNLQAIHAAAKPVVTVPEFGGFSFTNLSSAQNLYAKVEFAAIQTLSMKLELLIRR